MSKYEDFGYIKTIGNFNEVIDDYGGWTYFHYICSWNSSNLEIIKYCIENGADFNNKNNNESTPFHILCDRRPTKEVLEYFLENGADLNIKNDDGNTPFYYICEYNKDLITTCKPYMNEYDYIKTLKKYNLNWKEYVL